MINFKLQKEWQEADYSLHLGSPLETVSFTDRAIETCWSEMLKDWILQPAFYSHSCLKQAVSIFKKRIRETGLSQN